MARGSHQHLQPAMRGQKRRRGPVGRHCKKSGLTRLGQYTRSLARTPRCGGAAYWNAPSVSTAKGSLGTMKRLRGPRNLSRWTSTL